MLLIACTFFATVWVWGTATIDAGAGGRSWNAVSFPASLFDDYGLNLLAVEIGLLAACSLVLVIGDDRVRE